ncbi:hypothetical protein [Enterobacter mori]|uniref:hypothetical protein n=1 Tax=Enterobacter mori TaxID=539813 RepID=UPI001BA75438|nr:hypothetical protein [Enterobacter mori]MBS0863177.1 hypothetical protein [Enterobacter mori]HDR2757625.1 hypothetical protein [Enterobacter mori]HDR2775959.1 hypothetical protein [Enterobacter mori]HED4182402.1 hypothetical protein [Enterobacter mori]
MSTQVKHTSYTEKNGYVWRQRYAGGTLAITLKTKDEKEAAQRSGAMSIRFTQLEQQAVPFTSMRETLRAYCDDLYRMAKLAFLNMMMNLVAGNPALLSQGQILTLGIQLLRFQQFSQLHQKLCKNL